MRGRPRQPSESPSPQPSPSQPPPPWDVVALAPFAPTDDPSVVGVVPSTNEVFFRSAGSFEITVVAPHTGTFQGTLAGRPGSTEFDASSTSLCTHANIANAGNTNSFWLCTSPLAECKIYSFSTSGLYPTNQLDLQAGVNTLWLRRRETCALASRLSITPAPPPSQPPAATLASADR
jgi:hypothetical protein